jgi:hypothetical protein
MYDAVPAQRILLHLIAGAAIGAALAAPVRAPAQGRPDCADVLRAMHPRVGHKGPEIVDSYKIAEKLGVQADWVERCAQTYGRRVKPRQDEKHPALEGDSEVVEQRESEEYDEVSREEKETAGDKYFTVIENDERDRKRLEDVRNQDMIEWKPEENETHEWKPDEEEQRPWRPAMHDDED